jgi:hypothetical protein
MKDLEKMSMELAVWGNQTVVSLTELQEAILRALRLTRREALESALFTAEAAAASWPREGQRHLSSEEVMVEDIRALLEDTHE